MTGDFLFATFDGGGNIPPLAGAVRRLRARGHAVRVLADDASRADLEGAGAVVVPWRTAYNRPNRRPETDPLRDWEPTEPGGGRLRLLDRLIIGPAAAYAADTIAELRRQNADVVVSCDLLFGSMLAAEATGTRLAVMAANISLLPIPGMPPVGPGLMPPRNQAEREAAELVAAQGAAALAERLPTLNAARAQLGLAPLTDAFDQMRAADLHLLGTSRAFDFPVPALPHGMRYVGPLLDPPAWAGDWVSPWPESDARPLVLVALSSTFQDQAPVIRRVIEAAVGQGVRVVVTLGPGLAGSRIQGGPDVQVVDGVSHDQILSRAALVVTHAGHGTVMRALAHSRPMLCLPMGRDQNDNAARVVAHGAGLRLSPQDDTATIGVALRRLLREPRFAASAAGLGRAIAAAEPESALVDALEELLDGRSSRAAA